MLVPGGSVYACDAGEGDALLCLHGGPGASHGYLTYGLRALASTFRPIFFDQRGGGRSVTTGAGRPSFRDLLDDIESLCEAYRLERLGLVGHSWGALLALSYALVTRREVTGVALVNALPLGSDLLTTLFEFIFARTEDARVTRRLSRVEATLAASGAVQRERAVAFAHQTVPLFVRTKNWSRLPQYEAPVDWQMEIWSAAQQHVQRNRRALPSVLVVQGEEDVATADDVARSLGDIGQARAVTIPHCGHVAPLEAPRELCGVLRRYFERGASARGPRFSASSSEPRCESP